ncbi:hypothetical protein MTR67_049356 [Solanum verrucosum]|uniref:Uncharacterized protein n=1 Tax=Solanum verrucosum TaxID=315347 RepID=A0AAF0V341_SOLVR|nr:hypothetical protein MTR67_049356 [Solanum verrucosum]
MMTEAATVSSISLVTITDGEFQDGSLQTNPLLQSGTYIDAEPNNNVLPNEGKGANLTLALAGTTLEMQKTVLVAEMVMPVHQVNVERPSLLPGEWKFETKICHVDRPSETPQSKKQKSGSKTKKVRLLLFTLTLPIHQRVCVGFRLILMKIRENLLLMATWFLKPRNKNGMLSSQAYRS